MLGQKRFCSGDNGRQDVLLAAFAAKGFNSYRRSKTDIRREHHLSGKEELGDDLAKLSQALFINISPAQPGDRAAEPWGRDYPADDCQHKPQSRYVLEDEVDAGQPSFNLLGRAGRNGGVGFPVAGADVHQGSSGLQVPDGAPQCRHAVVDTGGGGKEDVVTRMRQIIQEGDFGGDPADILTAQLREDDQRVVCPRMVGDDEQRALGRDMFRTARRDAALGIIPNPGYL